MLASPAACGQIARCMNITPDIIRLPAGEPECSTAAHPAQRRIVLAWLALAAALAVPAGLLVAFRQRFAWERELSEMPSLALAGGLVVAGLLYLLVPLLIRATLPCPRRTVRDAMLVMLVAGLGLRLAMLATAPAFEDDYFRYLWDGGVTAAGHNPYALSPQAALALGPGDPLGRLAQDARIVIERTNHNGIKTIYPPVTAGRVRAGALDRAVEPGGVALGLSRCRVGDAGAAPRPARRDRPRATVGGALLVEPAGREGDHERGAHGGDPDAAGAGERSAGDPQSGAGERRHARPRDRRQAVADPAGAVAAQAAVGRATSAPAGACGHHRHVARLGDPAAAGRHRRDVGLRRLRNILADQQRAVPGAAEGDRRRRQPARHRSGRDRGRPGRPCAGGRRDGRRHPLARPPSHRRCRGPRSSGAARHRVALT